ncbi:hypothetical protein GCM10010497_08080 [Streptomyces cinereoruber]|uniref:Uncharacterized protein n=1 Tax=Streptomyces cinereoruber TaxID=67260 RepID=A0AAV4KE81_9ACTN|nr:hypothetical protein [Streptomyces cinereoruber]NIH59896.1 hypothetical protein [Streptomyces cinereoruber]GGR08609.1 hypothetical protein GCM10010497_08080 [Streptomyces cinereoruber]
MTPEGGHPDHGVAALGGFRPLRQVGAPRPRSPRPRLLHGRGGMAGKRYLLGLTVDRPEDLNRLPEAAS